MGNILSRHNPVNLCISFLLKIYSDCLVGSANPQLDYNSGLGTAWRDLTLYSQQWILFLALQSTSTYLLTLKSFTRPFSEKNSFCLFVYLFACLQSDLTLTYDSFEHKKAHNLWDSCIVSTHNRQLSQKTSLDCIFSQIWNTLTWCVLSPLKVKEAG